MSYENTFDTYIPKYSLISLIINIIKYSLNIITKQFIYIYIYNSIQESKHPLIYLYFFFLGHILIYLYEKLWCSNCPYFGPSFIICFRSFGFQAFFSWLIFFLRRSYRHFGHWTIVIFIMFEPFTKGPVSTPVLQKGKAQLPLKCFE